MAVPRLLRLAVATRFRVAVLGVMGLVSALVLYSLAGALTASGTDSVSARLAEWTRDHGGTPLVNLAERLTYRSPRVGGQPGTNALPAAARGDPGAVLSAVAATPHVVDVLAVGFATTTGLSATAGGSTQTTGPGEVVGLPDSYRATFAGEIRDLVGASSCTSHGPW